MIRKIFLVAITMIAAAYHMPANSQTPYSMYGLGILDDKTLGVNSGMGGVGYAIDNNKQINPANPASYAAMDSLTFLFDVGMNVNVNWMKESTLKETKTTANFDYAVLQFPMGKRFAASLGVMPYSDVAYDYSSYIPLGAYSRTGSGGITQVYFGAAAKIWKELYFGVNAAFMFGNLTHSTTVLPASSYNVMAMIDLVEFHVTDYKIELGLRYTQPVNEKNSLTFGFVYSPQKKMLGKRYTNTYSLSSSDNSITMSVSDTTSLKSSYDIAASYGAGIGYKWDNRLLLGVDVTYQPWSKASFLPLWEREDMSADIKGNLHDRIRISFGGEYRHDQYARQYLRRVRYRLGAYYDDSYLKVGDANLREIGATLGLGFPLLQDRSIVNLSAQYFHRKLSSGSAITENGLIISVGISFNEMWFFKSKLQ